MSFTEGQYIYAGFSFTYGCPVYNTYQSEEAILEGPLFNGSTKLCSISFSHYRSYTSYRGKYEFLFFL